MKYLRKFATEAEVFVMDSPNVVLVEDAGKVLYNVDSLGVYIQHINGKLYRTEAWTANGFANDLANGVALVSNECCFVIAKTLSNTSSLKWGGQAQVLDGVVTFESETAAVLDYDGAGNTSKIIEQLSGYTDNYGITGAPAAEACANYVFPNGQKGYLPSCGEWNMVGIYKSAITSAMNLIGGNGLSKSYYWTSSQAIHGDTWILKWSGLVFDRAGRSNSSAYALAFTTLNI